MDCREALRVSLRARLGVAVVMIALFSPAAADAAGTGMIKGEITGPVDTPLAEVWACAYLAQDEEFEENCDLTGADGLYSIAGLEAGDYKIEFWSESTEPSYVGEFYDDKALWEEADEVEVKEGVATIGIDAELAEGATIKGQIDAVSVGGPVEDAIVCLHLLPEQFVGCARNQPDGSYTLSGVPPGEYKVSFLPAFPRYNLLNQFYDHRSSFAEADPLAVTAGETKTGIDADLEAGAEIRGTVHSAETGAVVGGVQVCALFADAGEAEWPLRECVLTSAAGSYALVALTTDSYKVVFSPELKEFFGEEVFEGEDDGYLNQYFNNKPTLASADVLSLVAPVVRTGIDARLQPAHPASPLSSPGISPVAAQPMRRRRALKRCRPGFRRKRVAGKRRCVRVHKHKRHRRGHHKGRDRS
jgi:hypothetical protein